jgi:peptide deformylase
VHAPVRIFAVEVQDNPRYPYKPNVPLTILVNPVIEPISSETFENYEGCLSVPNLRGVVDRYAEIRIRSLDRNGHSFDRIVRGLTAGTFQHEADHLDGVLFIDRVKDPRTLSTWTEFERHHRQAFVDRITSFVQRMGG